MQLINDTQFSAQPFINMDKSGAEILVLLAKATFELPSDYNKTVPIIEQLPIEASDVYEGEEGISSLRYESDIGMPKTSTDIIFIGHAYAKTIGDPFVDVLFRAGPLSKVARVFGDRCWENNLGTTKISKPQPFKKIPLVYERAFGGLDNSHSDQNYHEYEQRNPVGLGFRAKHSKAPVDGCRLPNIENPKEFITHINDRPEPVGFGFVGKHWSPRINYLGTYDDDWKKNRMPLLPSDFDERFNSAASLGLTAGNYLEGGELIEIINASENGHLKFSLPKISILGSLMVDVEISPIEMNLDTVVVDTDSNHLILHWRGMQNIHNVVEDVRWVRVAVG